MLEPQLTTPEGVVYDDDAHTYLLDGKPVPSVSAMLKVIDPDQYAGIPEAVLDRAAQRGSNSHAMIALDCRGELDFASIDDRTVEHYLAWDNFRADYDFEVMYSERVVCSRKYQYCGTLDLIGMVTIKRKRYQFLIDAKFTAALPELIGPQSAGYRTAALESIPELHPGILRAALWIQGEKYKFIEHKQPSDNATFLAARTILNWRET